MADARYHGGTPEIIVSSGQDVQILVSSGTGQQVITAQRDEQTIVRTGRTGVTTIVGDDDAKRDVLPLTEDEAYLFLGTSGVQGPEGPGIELRRVGTSPVIQWRHASRDGIEEHPWVQLIDLGDGSILVKRQPPELSVVGVTVVDDPGQTGVTIAHPDPAEDRYELTFRIPRGATGEQGLPGRDGRDGIDGRDAYQVWLETGYSGSEQDFFNSITTGFRWVQDEPRHVWEITHPLKAKFPSVSVTDSTGRPVEGEPDYTGPHTLTITFSAQIAGEAYLT